MKENKKEVKQKKEKIYEIPEILFKQVLNYIANSKSDFKTAEIFNFTLALHNIKPIEKENENA
jgi:hypothetical protein